MSPGQMLRGRAWSSGLGPPPPSLGSWKKSSLIGSLAVSFTLNIKVKQKSQASLCWQREGKAVSSGASLSRNCLPSPLPAGPRSPALSAGGAQHRDPGRAWPRREPLLAQPGRMPPQPRRHSAQQSKHAKCGAGSKPRHPTRTSSSCPILLSRLKNKIQTIGERRPRAALGSTRTGGLCTAIR